MISFAFTAWGDGVYMVESLGYEEGKLYSSKLEDFFVIVNTILHQQLKVSLEIKNAIYRCNIRG